jgi:hypothetical protein
MIRIETLIEQARWQLSQSALRTLLDLGHCLPVRTVPATSFSCKLKLDEMSGVFVEAWVGE